MVPAVIAGVHLAARHAVILRFLATLYAWRPIREPLLAKKLKAGVIIREITVEIVDRVPQVRGDGLLYCDRVLFHDNYMIS
jgi:hypothetical protein